MESAEVFVARIVSSPAAASSFAENFLLQRHVFHGGFNHEVHVAQRHFGGGG